MEDRVTQCQNLVTGLAEQMCSSIGILQSQCSASVATQKAVPQTVAEFATLIASIHKTALTVAGSLPRQRQLVMSGTFSMTVSSKEGLSYDHALGEDLTQASNLALTSRAELESATVEAMALQKQLQDLRQTLTDARFSITGSHQVWDLFLLP